MFLSYRIVPLLIGMLLLAACGSLPTTQDDSYVVESREDVGAKEKVRPQPGTSKAVLALLGEARQAALNGQLARSESFLERALRIEPRNAVLWHYMAKLRLNQGRLKEAAGLAAKSNSLDNHNRILQADNWQIIAHARHKSGDLEGAKRAQQKSQQLRASP